MIDLQEFYELIKEENPNPGISGDPRNNIHWCNSQTWIFKCSSLPVSGIGVYGGAWWGFKYQY
jgi:hypothetical protein